MQHSSEIFSLLIEKHTERYPLGRRGFGADALAIAVHRGDDDMVKYMLEKNMDADEIRFTVGGDSTYNYTRMSPFGVAIAKCQETATSTVERFLQRGAKPENVVAETRETNVRVTAFLAAIGTKKPSTVELFIKYEADVNFSTRGPVKRTPLQRAAEIGNMEIVELLYNHGAEVNAPAARRSGGTALQLAAFGGYIPVVCKLLTWKANVNAPASKVNGRTALEGAAEHGRLDTVQLLLNAGAGSSREGRQEFDNATALAEDKGHFAICNLLKDHLRSGDFEFSLDQSSPQGNQSRPENDQSKYSNSYPEHIERQEIGRRLESPGPNFTYDLPESQPYHQQQSNELDMTIDGLDESTAWRPDWDAFSP